MEVTEFNSNGSGIYTTKYSDLYEMLLYIEHHIETNKENSYIKINTLNYTNNPLEISLIDCVDKDFIMIVLHRDQPIAYSSWAIPKINNEQIQKCIDLLWNTIIQDVPDVYKKQLPEYCDIYNIIIKI
jgi:hypothetical protein